VQACNSILRRRTKDSTSPPHSGPTTSEIIPPVIQDNNRQIHDNSHCLDKRLPGQKRRSTVSKGPKGLEPVSSLPGSKGQVRVGNPSPCPAEALSGIYDANPHSARGELQMDLFLHTGHLKLKILPGFLLDDPS